MFAAKIPKILPRSVHFQSARNYQISIVGVGNPVGQTLAMLLRNQPMITKLIVHDFVEQTPGVAIDLSHIPSETPIKAYYGAAHLDKALRNSDLIIATGGILRYPGILKKTWFCSNADFIRNVTTRVAHLSTKPFFGIVTEPINTLVPMAAEILRSCGAYDPRKLFGITTIDQLRANSMYAQLNSSAKADVLVPMIGGHSEKTSVPLLSQVENHGLSEKQISEFSHRVRRGSDSVFLAKKGWSPSLSVAFGAYVFAQDILDALCGKKTLTSAYVDNNDFGTGFFAGLVEVDHMGVGDMQTYSKLTQFECYLLERSIEQIRKDVSKGKKILELA